MVFGWDFLDRTLHLDEGNSYRLSENSQSQAVIRMTETNVKKSKLVGLII